jgi:pimeloyl-ACP methyl ester carboxylesterase
LPDNTIFEVMHGCGHFPFLEEPSGFAALVRRFLDSHS